MYCRLSRDGVLHDFSVLGKSFDNCLENLRWTLIRCEETNLVLNWEKCHFMVKEGIQGTGFQKDEFR